MQKLLAATLLVSAHPALYSQTRGAVRAPQDVAKPHPVRNGVAQSGEEIITIRYFRIKKGTFDQFLKASQEDVWPYFDKIGARVIGMWKVIEAEGVEGQTKPKDCREEPALPRQPQLNETREPAGGCSFSLGILRASIRLVAPLIDLPRIVTHDVADHDRG